MFLIMETIERRGRCAITMPNTATRWPAASGTAYLVAPVTVVLGGLILEERPPVLAIAGGSLAIAGVIIARSRRRVGTACRLVAET